MAVEWQPLSSRTHVIFSDYCRPGLSRSAAEPTEPAVVAGALNLIGAQALYGRNWGCLGDYKFLHFEACYYQAIEFAIARGLERVEAGAQGPHKLQRGYLPVPTYSAHWFRDPGLHRAVAQFLKQERVMVAQEHRALAAHSPFRKGDGDGQSG